MNGAVAIYSPSPLEGRLRQGEILTNLIQVKVALASLRQGNDPSLERIVHPFAIVASQDCELEQDYRLREKSEKESLPNVLFCEVMEAERTRAGPPPLVSRIWDRVKTNQSERYHFLQRILPSEDRQGSGLPSLCIDFKRYFTIPTDEVYYHLPLEIKRRCFLNPPWLEHFSDRLCHFLSRVALPVEHKSD